MNVAITYCPLTATAQGFKRGNTTLGVSGQLLNSNLVMYDRDSGTWFSQIASTGVRGKHRNRSLVEVNVIWTTWERWRKRHPDTQVLSDKTGHLRNYSRDPYGRYNPIGGYYQQDGTVFPLLHTDRKYHAKEMVVGARTDTHSAYFVLTALKSDRIQKTQRFIAAYDQDLDTGFIYRAPGDSVDVRATPDGHYEVDGKQYRADELPLESLVSVDAFYFAWNTFYPNSEFPRGSRR
jgi:hypothetical protein